MELTLTEAATVLGKSARTIRAWLRTGRLPGVKRGGHWVLDRAALPLTDSQRHELQERADRLRTSVDAMLPSRTASRSGDRRKTLADLGFVQHACALLRNLRAAGEPMVSAAAALESALMNVARGHHEFHPSRKQAPPRRARHRRALAPPFS